jgi:hypothetical protein
MEPSRAADLLITALAKESDASARQALAGALSWVAARMEPSRAADLLITALAKETNAYIRQALAGALSWVAARMEPSRAAEVSAQATDLLITALAKETNAVVRRDLAGALSWVAARMEPTRAAEVSAQAADLLIAALAKEPDSFTRQALARNLLLVTHCYSAQEYQRTQNSLALAFGAVALPHNILPSLVLLHPQPRPLPPQVLVELLKNPFCVGETRRIVLAALEITYGRKFIDQWEFVEYAQKYQPQLDLLTPPKRPQQ